MHCVDPGFVLLPWLRRTRKTHCKGHQLAQMREMKVSAKTIFAVWLNLMLGEKTTKLVGTLSMRWSADGHNVAKVA